MKLLRNLTLAALALAIPASLSAQVNHYNTPPAPLPGLGVTGTLDYTGHKGGDWVYDRYVINNGYNGALGGDTFDMFCVDPANDATDADGPVYITPLKYAGNFSGTQYTYNSDRNKYLQAAWLISNFSYNNPDSGTNGSIQGAIWQIMGGLPSGYNAPNINAWVADAQMEANYTSVNMARYAVLSGTGYPQGEFGQEFMVQLETVPEPASLLLLMTGLVGIGGVATRRRNG